MKKVSLRVLSAILAFVLIVATGVTAVTALETSNASAQNNSDGREVVSTTDAKIVADYYNFVGAKEAAVLNCNAIIGDNHTIAVPNDGDDLIAIDAENKTVSVVSFVSGDYVWNPVKAYLVYTDSIGTEMKSEIALDANGQGSFETDLESYSIEVDYEVKVAIDLDLQRELVNAPAILANGLINLNLVSACKGDLETVASDAVFDALMKMTRPVTHPVYTNISFKVFTENDPGYGAILSMNADREANGGTFSLLNEIAAYELSDSKVEYLAKHGDAFKDAYGISRDIMALSADLSSKITTIMQYKDMDMVDETTYNNLVLVNGILKTLAEDLQKAPAANWDFVNHTLVKENATELELAALDLAVAGTLGANGTTSLVAFHNSEKLVSELVAATTSIRVGVAQSKVNVAVNAQVIGSTTENSNALSTVNGKTVSFLISEDATEDDIKAKIQSTGIIEETLAYWAQNAAVYNINGDNYTYSYEIVEQASGDINVNITFVPVSFTITTDYSEAYTVYYGYRLKLANHADSGKSYDYKVNNVAKYQGEIIKVTSNLNITRTEGTALHITTIPSMVADSSIGAALTSEACNVLKANAYKADYANLFGTLRYRVPTVATFEATSEENGYKVTAPSVVSGLLSGATWSAVSVDLLNANGAVLATYEIENGACEFTYAGAFENARINFALVVSDISSGDVKTIANIPHTLATDASEQIAILNRLAEGNLYSQLGTLSSSTINLIVTVVSNSDMSDVAKQSVAKLKTDCVDAAGNVILYTQLTAYKAAKAKGAAEGLKYYYTGNNAQNLKYQLDILSEVFNALCPNDVNHPDRVIFTDLLTSNGLSEYVTKLDSIKQAIDDCKDITPVNQYVDTNSASIGSLATAVYNAIGKTSEYNADASVVLNNSIVCAAPDKSTVNIVINVVRGDGTTQTLTDTVTLEQGATVGNAIKNKVEALDAQLTIDKNYYNVSGMNNIPTGNVVIDTIGNVIITYTPYEYTVSVPGTADQVFYFDADWTITLPASSDNGVKLVYTVAGETVEVIGEDVRYTFDSLDVFGSDRRYEVTVEGVNLDTAKLLQFIDLMNESVEVMGAKFIPLEDENGNITIVFRVSSSVSAESGADMMTNLAYALTLYNNVKLGGNLFWDGSAVHLQAMTDMVASSGFDFNLFCDVVTADGKVINDAGLSALAPMVATNGNVGGKLMTSTIEVDGKVMSFYVTISDTTSPSVLSTMRKVVAALKDYINIVCEDGKFQFVITAPDAVYPYYLAQMLVSGNVSLTDISALNLKDSIMYEWSLIESIIDDERLSTETFENTFAQFGKDVDLSAFEGLMNNFKKAHKYLENNIDFVEVESSTDAFGGTLMIDLYGVFQRVADTFGLDDMVMSFIYEADREAAPYEINIEVKLSNIIDKDYEAIVFDINGNGLTKKFYCTNDLEAVLNNLGNYGFVILTSDVEFDSNVRIPSNAIINLNGYTIKGDITSGGTVRVVDSRIGTEEAGSIDGKLSGNFLLTAGKYTDDVAKYLKTGYSLTADGYVRNNIYTVRHNGNDIEIALSAEYLNNTELVDLQTLLVDVAVDVAINLYSGAAIAIDGNYIYNFGCKDITSVLGGGKVEILNSIIDIFDAKGFSNVLNSVATTVLDFEALAAAINNNEALVDYEISIENWSLVAYITDGNYISFDSTPSNKETGKFTIVIDGSEEAKAELAQLCTDLSVIEINNFEINLNDISYGNGFDVDFNGDIDIHIDLSKNRAYAALICASAAYSSNNWKDKAVYKAALEMYLAGEGTDAIVEAIEGMTTAEFIAACKAMNGVSVEEMLNALGIETSEKTLGMVALMSSYDNLVKICAKVLTRLGVSGNSSDLAGNKVGYATYVFEKEFVGRMGVKLAITTVYGTGSSGGSGGGEGGEGGGTSGDIVISAPTFNLSSPEVSEVIKGYETVKLPSGLTAIIIDTANEGLPVEKFIDMLTFSVEGAYSYSITVYDANGRVVTDGLMCTGYVYKVTATNGLNVLEESHTVVIAGDTNGNGIIDSGDAVRISGCYKGTLVLTEAELIALDINNNGKIDSGDAMRVQYKYKNESAYESLFNTNK